jgi:hypothetical protein
MPNARFPEKTSSYRSYNICTRSKQFIPKMKNSLLYGIWKHFPHMFCTHLSSVLAPYLICCTWKTTHKTIRKVCSSSFTTTQKQTYTYSSPSHPSRDMFCVLPKMGDKKLLRFSTHNKSKLLLPIEHAV